MASAGEENLAKTSERRTRSGRKLLVTTQPLAASARTIRRSVRKHTQDQLTEHEAPEIINDVDDDQLCAEKQQRQSDIITEMLAEAAKGVINCDATGVVADTNIIYEEVQQEIIDGDVVQPYEDCVVYEEQADDHDAEMYQEEQLNIEVAVACETGLDDKSSSFPFGNVGQSETSEEAQNEEEVHHNHHHHHEEINETGAAESSLLASLAGDNANSLPSVGAAEDIENKRDNFEVKVARSIPEHCEKMESDDSLSEPAIAEDIDGAGLDGSDATIVNTEMVSEDELPPPSKPEINDAEEVSDDELPAPQRAELPADAEVISEDEFPSATEKKSSENTNEKLSLSHASKEMVGASKHQHKRKAHADIPAVNDRAPSNAAKSSEKNDEQYNPMSPTSESNEATPPQEKKLKMESSSHEGEHKERKKERERERDKEKAKEKDKARDIDYTDKENNKDKERNDKEKERKKLPDLDKYWRAVKEDPADFTGWTYLLQYVDNESDPEAAREAYDEFLSHYPYCYGYWRKYADYEKRKGVKANCNAVFERGLEAIPLSVDLWIHYLAHVRSNHADNENYVRAQFDRAIEACGLEFRSDKLWDAYIKWETEGKRYQRVLEIYDRLLCIPTQGYSGHFDSFQDLINQHSIGSILSDEELQRIRSDVRESTRAASKTGAKSTGIGRDSKSPTQYHKVASESLGDTAGDNMTDDITGDASMAHTVSSEKTPSTDLADSSMLDDDEISAIKDKVISVRRKQHKATVAAVTARWTYEEGIKRPYFHVKPLERCQLKNWKDYLDYEIEQGNRQRILVLFERCLIACALYDEFWLKMIRYLETQMDQPAIPAIASEVYRRACHIHHRDKPSLHLMWAAFEECQNHYDRAAEILQQLEQKCPHLLQVAYRRINVERRRGDFTKCRELYEHYILEAKNKTIAGSLAIKYARFLNKVCNDLDGGLRVLRQALEKDGANTRVALQMVDLALQRPIVDEDEVVVIMDRFMAREQIDPEQKILFAQRKVEFLEDFGSSAKGLQDAQRALQLALSKANEAKKKRESSPTRKCGAPATAKDPVASGAATATQAMYNNGTTAGYNYPSGNNSATAATAAYYSQQGNTATYQQQQQQSYDGYYQWQQQYGGGGGAPSNYSGSSGYGQWSGYGNYY